MAVSVARARLRTPRSVQGTCRALAAASMAAAVVCTILVRAGTHHARRARTRTVRGAGFDAGRVAACARTLLYRLPTTQRIGRRYARPRRSTCAKRKA
ncbi:hypothetical protein PT2222_10278 [Paraburkholderia tropica]